MLGLSGCPGRRATLSASRWSLVALASDCEEEEKVGKARAETRQRKRPAAAIATGTGRWEMVWAPGTGNECLVRITWL